MEGIKQISVENVDADLKERDDKIAELENDMKEQDEIMVALTNEVKKARDALKQRIDSERNSPHETNWNEAKQELESLKSDKEFLDSEVTRLQLELNITEKGTAMKKMKNQVVEAEEERIRFEKTMISSYERKLSLLQMNKDVTVDGLRKQLAQSMEKLKNTEIEVNAKIKSIQHEKNDNAVKVEKNISAKDAKIQFLEQTLSAHEEVSGHMKAELDQLQNGMENMSMTRRSDVEELQQELIDIQSRATRYEREITALKMKLDERKLRHKDDVIILRQTISQLETETPMMRDMQAQREEKQAGELASKYEQLKWRTSELQRENKLLRGKLESIKLPSEDRASKNDKWRNSALQEQILVLQQRVKEFEVEQIPASSPSNRRKPRKPQRTSSKDSQIPRASKS